MDSHKKIISDLKSYNQDLEKHLSKLDFESISNQSILDINSPNNFDKDNFFSLLGTSIIDIRTEIALLRKHLTTDIENVVQNQVNLSQKLFFDEMNNFFLTSMMQMQEGFAGHIKSINEELANLKLVIKDSSSNEDKMVSRVETKLNIFMEKNLFMNKNLVKKSELYEKNINLLNTNILNLKNSFSESFDKRTHYEKLDFISNQFDKVSNSISLKNDSIELKLNKINNELRLQNDLDKKSPILVRDLEKIKTDNLVTLENGIEKVESFNPKIGKILEIDKRLARLNSFK